MIWLFFAMAMFRTAKDNFFKGPIDLPRQVWYCAGLFETLSYLNDKLKFILASSALLITGIKNYG